MSESDILYHGSPNKIDGALGPVEAEDELGREANQKKAVYATDEREIAIAMAILHAGGVKASRCRFEEEPYGIIYEGEPEQEFIYLYTLPVESFQREGGKGRQYFSREKVEPMEKEKLEVKNYQHLIKYASEEERKRYYERHGWQDRL